MGITKTISIFEFESCFFQMIKLFESWNIGSFTYDASVFLPKNDTLPTFQTFSEIRRTPLLYDVRMYPTLTFSKKIVLKYKGSSLIKVVLKHHFLLITKMLKIESSLKKSQHLVCFFKYTYMIMLSCIFIYICTWTLIVFR